MTIEASTDRAEVLPGAALRHRLHRRRPREVLAAGLGSARVSYGIRQPLGENGGPGAVFHTARNAPMILDIARDMERLCPDAWLMNFTNPVPRMTLLASRYSKIKTVGLCHQIGMGYAIVAYTLAEDLGLERAASDEWGLYGLGHQAHDLLDIKAAGINHFTFMLDIRDKRTGEDLYPLFRRRCHELARQLPAPDPPHLRRLRRLPRHR